jgi:CheY-like chemotaxis protein
MTTPMIAEERGRDGPRSSLRTRTRLGHAGKKTIGDVVRAPCVLVAEDDDSIRAMVAAAFKRDGYDVIEACSGAELLDHIGSSILFGSSYPPPDVIVSDIRMPGFTGLEILAGLRQAGWDTPIVLMTAFGDEHVRDAAKKVGANAVFIKPFEIDALSAAVRGMLPLDKWLESDCHFG